MESHNEDVVENSPSFMSRSTPCKVCPFSNCQQNRTGKNRACMYFLDIPVICSLDKEYEILRELVEVHERNEGQRRVRPRTKGLTLGETNLKFTPYDCCSFQGERDVHLGSLLRIFRPLRVVEKHAQALFRTLSTCNWGSCGVVSCCRNFTFYVSHEGTKTLKCLVRSF